MPQAYRVALLVLAALLGSAPASAGSFEDDIRARWRGAWVTTEIETWSTCNGSYYNNDVSGQFVAARAGRKFEPGELAKVDKVQVHSKKVELYLTVAETILQPWQDGPFTLLAERTCQIELEVALPKNALRAKNVSEIDRLLAVVANRYSTQDEALAAAEWNRRDGDDYPADYEKTLAQHAVWRAEETNRSIDEQLDRALAMANELAREIDRGPAYLDGFARGAQAMREWRERDCDRLVGSTAVTFRLGPPQEFTDNTTWCAGFNDGQALIYNLAVLTRLPGCYVDVPELPAEFTDAEVARRQAAD